MGYVVNRWIADHAIVWHALAAASSQIIVIENGVNMARRLLRAPAPTPATREANPMPIACDIPPRPDHVFVT